jgi:hypothetical protein
VSGAHDASAGTICFHASTKWCTSDVPISATPAPGARCSRPQAAATNNANVNGPTSVRWCGMTTIA